jgi:hypothetical protein
MGTIKGGQIRKEGRISTGWSRRIKWSRIRNCWQIRVGGVAFADSVIYKVAQQRFHVATMGDAMCRKTAILKTSAQDD